MSRKLGVGCLVLGVAILFCLTLVSAIPQTINVHGKLSNSTGALTGTYSMNFSIYSGASGGSPVYSSVMNIMTDGSGVYNAILSNVDLPFSVQYYLGIKVESDAEMTPRINLTSSPYALENGNFFKLLYPIFTDMLPSDPSGSLDESFFGGIYG